jgi:hypothetical protein
MRLRMTAIRYRATDHAAAASGLISICRPADQPGGIFFGRKTRRGLPFATVSLRKNAALSHHRIAPTKARLEGKKMQRLPITALSLRKRGPIPRERSESRYLCAGAPWVLAFARTVNLLNRCMQIKTGSNDPAGCYYATKTS